MGEIRTFEEYFQNMTGKLAIELSQMKDRKERVIICVNKAFFKQEREYCVTHRELYTAVKTLERFQKYLTGVRISNRSCFSKMDTVV